MKDEQWVEAVEDNWPKLRYMESEMKEETVWDGATKVKIMVMTKLYIPQIKNHRIQVT